MRFYSYTCLELEIRHVTLIYAEIPVILEKKIFGRIKSIAWTRCMVVHQTADMNVVMLHRESRIHVTSNKYLRLIIWRHYSLHRSIELQIWNMKDNIFGSEKVSTMPFPQGSQTRPIVISLTKQPALSPAQDPSAGWNIYYKIFSGWTIPPRTINLGWKLNAQPIKVSLYRIKDQINNSHNQ